MSDHVVHIAQAEIQAALDIAHVAATERDEARKEAERWRTHAMRLEAILAHLKTSLNEQFNDPATDGGPGRA